MTLHLGWCSPLPPARSGIADYSAELLPAIAERCDVTCFVEEPDDVSPELREHLRLRPLSEIETAADVLPVYHLGNHVGFHANILHAAMRRPGVVLLHELVLHELVQRVFLGQGQAAGFADWVRAAEPGVAKARLRAAMRCTVEPGEMPLCEPVVRAARMTIVLNAWAKAALAERVPDAAVAAAPHHSVRPPEQTEDRAALRARYRLPSDGYLLGSFGFLTPNKRLDIALRAFAEFHRECPDSYYIFAGPPSARLDLPALAEELGVLQVVRFYGYVSEPMWWDLLAVMDLCVSLRGPTQGETSGSLLRQLAAGKAVCVSGAGPELEYPENTVCRIPHGAEEVERLVAAFRRGRADPAWRNGLGAAARAHVADVHAMERSAAAIVQACERAAALPNPERGFDLAGALHGTSGPAAFVNRLLYRGRLDGY